MALKSAKMADVHATLHDVDSGSPYNTRNVIVRKYSSNSSAADWTYTFPEITNGHDELIDVSIAQQVTFTGTRDDLRSQLSFLKGAASKKLA